MSPKESLSSPVGDGRQLHETINLQWGALTNLDIKEFLATRVKLLTPALSLAIFGVFASLGIRELINGRGTKGLTATT